MKFYIVDVFASKPFSGNQLAVLINDENISSDQMLKIAKEFNYQEVTFVDPKSNDNNYKVRIFTPDREVPFAGHPTLGTSFVINKILNNNQLNEIILNLEVGKIPVKVEDNYYEMKQNQPVFSDIYSRKEIAPIISLNKKDIKKKYPIQFVSTGLGSLIIPIKNKNLLKNASIDHQKYNEFLKKNGYANLLLFTKENNDIICRVFVDDIGFGEDPATGSANGNLAAYLIKYKFFGKSKSVKYKVKQGEEVGRPSILFISARKSKKLYDIRVGGKVFFIAEGQITI